MAYKYLTYLAGDGPRAGILIGESVFNAQAITDNPNHRTMLGILNDWAAADPRFMRAAESAAGLGGGISLADTKILAPILYPGEIWAAGANYQDHIDEMKAESEFPAVNAKNIGGRAWHFSKSSRGAVTGHGSNHPLPGYSKSVDWEIELAVVVGRTASQVTAADALNYVAGYTIANDLSARDYVVRDGIAPDSPELQALLQAAPRLEHLSFRGLMTVPPMADDPEAARPFFKRLRALRDQIAAQHLPSIGLAELSMGMSQDFEVAIEEGSTCVRVGTAIFGERERP